MLVEVDRLTKRYNHVIAVNELTFSMDNEILGLIGPNGAGKTTTLKILLGLIKADGGSATIFGKDCWKDSFYIHQRTGVLHEKIRFFPQLTVKSHLELAASLFDVRNYETEISRVLRDVGIHHLRNRKIKSLSAGELQRLGLAQAIIGSPQLVLLDEPTSNLDPLGRRDFLEMIRILHRDRSMAFLICSHVLHELEQVCDKFVIIHRGRALIKGTPRDMSEACGLMGYEIVSHELEKVKEKIASLPQIKDFLIVGGNSIIVTFNKKDEPDVKDLVQNIGIKIVEVREIYPPLESVFKEVISKDEA